MDEPYSDARGRPLDGEVMGAMPVDVEVVLVAIRSAL
jgi:hypothetical protein